MHGSGIQASKENAITLRRFSSAYLNVVWTEVIACRAMEWWCKWLQTGNW